ncbi:MAG: DegT/DnrJ/EryC1/StrS family aminotransferase [Candidatus Margulisiibacteriota bacterium]
MPVPFFDLNRQNIALRLELDQAVAAVITSGKFILGETVAEFEREAAAYCGTAHAIGVASGTDALHLALKAVGVKAGDEVITTPFTFVATADAIAYCNATPVFVDIEPNTFNIDPAKIEAAITPKTKAIIPVHLYGQSCAMDKIMVLAKKHNLAVVEDCAQAIGAKLAGKKVGSMGNIGCFSFFPTKNLGCFGDGGLVTTNDARLADELRVLRGHGSRKTYHYDLIGFNSRLDALQAAVLSVKLPHLDEFIDRRRRNAAIYRQRLAGLAGVVLPGELPLGLHTYNQFTIRAKDRDRLIDHLKGKGVGAAVYYPLSLHLQTAFAGLGYKPGSMPQSELAQSEVLSLPIFPELTEAEAETTAAAVREFH